MIPLRFSREAFEHSQEAGALSDELARLLLPRLANASDPSLEAGAIVEDLRRAGHVLWSWDESDRFSTWGDDYANPPSRNRFIIEMRWPDPDEEERSDFAVEVTFGPWPRKESI